MRRTRDWIKLIGLVGLATVLTVGFTSIIEFPERSMAQPPAPVSLASLPLAQRPVVPQAQPLEDLGNAFTAVSESVRSAVVYIQVEARRDPHEGQRIPEGMERFFQFPQEPQVRQGSGSGFIISTDGYIVTNNHVVEDADRVDVILFDQRRFKAEVIGNDPLTDVAVIKIDGDDLPAVAMGNSDNVRVGEWVLAVGNPLGPGYTFTVTAGIVSGRGRRLESLRPQGESGNWSIHDFIQTDAAINRGNSGGPLVNIRGEVIGVNAAIASETGFYAGYGFAIPMNLARNVADQLISNGRVTRAQLGVQISDVTPEAAEFVGLEEIRGVLVRSFPDDSPAEEAGLEDGDVIVALDGEEVRYTAQLQQLVGFKRPGESVQVTVLRRGGERHSYSVRLGEAVTDVQETVANRPPEDIEDAGVFEPRLGIGLEPFGRETATRLGLERAPSGLVVTEVDRDGPARGKLAGSAPSEGYLEIITHVNGASVRSRDDVDSALQNISAGEVIPVRVTVIRGRASTSQITYIKVGDGVQ
jgi:serine protease Do